MIASASIQPRVQSVNGLVSIGQASRALGVSQQTLRAASNCGALKTYILPSGHRRYSLGDCYTFLGQGGDNPAANEQKVCCYARTSSSKQAKGFAKGEESDLTRQIETLLAYAKEHYGCSEPTVLKDVASGLSFGSARPAFNKLIEGMLRGEWSVVICNFKDRLARFGVEIIEKIAEHNGITIVYASDAPDKSSEEELTADLIAFTHVYSCRFYSRRSAEKRLTKPTTEVVRRILELSQQGHAARTIAEMLPKEGIDRDSSGKPITYPVVRRILRENAKVKEQLVGPNRGNSFARFAEQHIKLLGEKDGSPIQHATIYQHYKTWCVGQTPPESPISNRRVAEYLTAQGVRGKVNWQNRKIYNGLQLVGLDGAGVWSEQNKLETKRERREESRTL